MMCLLLLFSIQLLFGTRHKNSCCKIVPKLVRLPYLKPFFFRCESSYSRIILFFLKFSFVERRAMLITAKISEKEFARVIVVLHFREINMKVSNALSVAYKSFQFQVELAKESQSETLSTWPRDADVLRYRTNGHVTLHGDEHAFTGSVK